MIKEESTYQTQKNCLTNPTTSYIGLCTICEEYTPFDKHSENLRETFICKKCGSNSRNRHLAKVLCHTLSGGDNNINSLKELVKKFSNLRIYEAQASGAINSVLKNLDRYVHSEFFADIKLGSLKLGIRCENLQSLTFKDETFDAVITQDVFEHISKPWVAFKEVHRVLKPSGCHIFTIPYNKDSKTVERVKIEGNKEIYLLPKVFHEDSIGDGLVYTDFGCDVLDRLKDIGFSTEVIWSNEKDCMKNQIYWSVVFVSKKA